MLLNCSGVHHQYKWQLCTYLTQAFQGSEIYFYNVRARLSFDSLKE